MWEFNELFENGTLISRDSRKFELLVEEYLNDIYPLENWRITKGTNDGNKDIESVCELTGNSMWAEAKYTIHNEDNLSSRKYDSTLVSSLEIRNLIKVYFVTNAHISLALSERVKNFYYLTKTKKISFVDGTVLQEWIKNNPDIERKYFRIPLPNIKKAQKEIRVTSLRVLCMGDSYMIDSVSDEEDGFFVFTTKDYSLEINFRSYGLYREVSKVFCNDISVFEGELSSESFSCTIAISELFKYIEIDHRYNIEISYIINGERNICQKTYITFVSSGRQFEEQAKAYDKLLNYLKFPTFHIINLYGAKNTGKSWIMQNIKNDMLSLSKENQRIIYINFYGLHSDITDICRFLFSLMFDYSVIDISEHSLLKYCKSHRMTNTLLDTHNIKKIINFLRENSYFELQNLLNGAICSNTERLFDNLESFPFRRLYFIDNLHMLSNENRKIFDAIINACRNSKNALFFLADRNQLNDCINVELNYISQEQLKMILYEEFQYLDDTVLEKMSRSEYLCRPGLLCAFLKTGHQLLQPEQISHYYDYDFHSFAMCYDKGEFKFSDFTILFVCFIYFGVPIEFFSQSEIKEVFRLCNKGYLTIKETIVYPVLSIWNESIPQKDIDNKEELVCRTYSLMKFNSKYNIICKCALAKYYSEFYLQFFQELFEMINVKFQENNYVDVIHFSKVLLENSAAIMINPEQLNRVKYWYAYSSMHCDVNVNALQIFNKIKLYYNYKIHKSDVYYDAYSEIIDALYWSHKNYLSLPEQINKFQRIWRENFSLSDGISIRSYLTASNRMMVTYLAMDNFVKAERWLRKNVIFALTTGQREHIGYTYMDFAKGIYHVNLSRALAYLEFADSFFGAKEELRRHLDCQCEIQYVKYLISQQSVKDLYIAQAQLFQHGFWVQYYKSFIKVAICHIISKNHIDAQENILKAQAAIPIKNDERVMYLCSVINTFLRKKPTTYKNEYLCGSYKRIYEASHGNNFKCSEKIIYTIGDRLEQYVIDPRAW